MPKPKVLFANPNKPLPATEENGIKAIIYLQAQVNIATTEESARRGWNSLSLSDKKQTMLAYQALGGK